MNKQLTKDYSPYLTFNRSEWSALSRRSTIPLEDLDLQSLQGVNDRLSLSEVTEVYQPISQLLNLYYLNAKNMHKDSNHFLQMETKKVPYIIGIAGSVAVGKSTTARMIQYLISEWPEQPKVDLVTTDGFLYPNEILESKGLMKKKGFPESYDISKLFKFLSELKSGQSVVQAPVYSHLTYNIVRDEMQTLTEPDIVIVEGINVLQPPKNVRGKDKPFISDFFDFSIYIDAEEANVEKWYKERFQLLRSTAFKNPKSYFNKFAKMSEGEALAIADRIWKETNHTNLKKNILPTKNRADLIIEKGEGHRVTEVKVRKL
ncbi:MULTISPECIES: type I pantothenate kinase [Cytobacillus]|uniref:type I pantothenate kinase n=1 Tax=Cytobacillus TaxID=2675230 RepID=UPI001CD3B24E|nr:type I pantothenate kinase [Cytobacillus kochii]MCA1024792.1 type I pantothenate kinase [Cytobacillus kochii]MCM3323725.1 type I pantothenate kinase [Cytobacillus kochii]MCM3346094.1 type I pantothenate kinase [Cytobacillus kochii]MDQ0187649.1 type I pantothenate kinase [Cytobacillus kochii]